MAASAPAATAATPSLSTTLRRLHSADHSLAARILSIAADADWVAAVAELAPHGTPVFANLRCGAWYAPQGAPTCYFKSTDGHTGQWAFSLRRLNAHVAIEAAAAGAALIVDATRRGKPLPDALSKTVPLWAAVLNRAAGWDPAANSHAALHTPPAIPASEAHDMAACVAPAADALAAAADLSQLTTALAHKPLRVLWVAQTHRNLSEWPALTHPATLPFIPIICVSASAPREELRATALTPSSLSFSTTYTFIQGAADDEELWAPPGLNAESFHARLPALPNARSLDEIATLFAAPLGRLAVFKIEPTASPLTAAAMHIARTSDLPQELWPALEAETPGLLVVNVSDELAPGELQFANPDCDGHPPPGWLFLNVPVGKKHRYALERAIPRLLDSLAAATAHDPPLRLLFHCPDGHDRSAAAALAALVALKHGLAGVSKTTIRDTYVELTQLFPSARVARAHMKQVNRAFTSQYDQHA
ncbi:initiator tRNA phosphoribosyl transferase [Thecamonas trahens ATCC 50062]|uniref:Initiator tRNA phosphoribosyl transferase n=1 Tax=Thecamonas trahens ATCC 50062 TaxID=461836 RepID=A0A0L0D870_THETB|nr:initiator tRNA phosphoribosyl transferase [Thecamonas trahens ATCC 50062]KNC48266.1 initiator tRNA phosphoribosyl transferase [Thecamonas trahens ATCC 50062]|eukprot:XP_013758833.1 initiator tRNA phosphoribosyl transferase [Thecamonas trahens ATCC 50062]